MVLLLGCSSCSIIHQGNHFWGVSLLKLFEWCIIDIFLTLLLLKLLLLGCRGLRLLLGLLASVLDGLGAQTIPPLLLHPVEVVVVFEAALVEEILKDLSHCIVVWSLFEG